MRTAKICVSVPKQIWEDDAGGRFVAVLEIPPVVSAVTAVRASIIADKEKRKMKWPLSIKPKTLAIILAIAAIAGVVAALSFPILRY